MWKKDDASQALEPPPVTPPSKPRPNEIPAAGATTRGRASIGRSITIRGEVTGDEDLLIEGRVDGSVDLKQHSVTVGAEGLVKAGITGRVVTVEGTVEGDLRAEEVVVLRSTARVQGDVTAPRLVLEDGASFRGAVDMGDPSGGRDRGAPRAPETRSVAADAKGTGSDAQGSSVDGKGGREPSSSQSTREAAKSAATGS